MEESRGAVRVKKVAPFSRQEMFLGKDEAWSCDLSLLPQHR